MVGQPEVDKREIAVKRLKEKSDFHLHLLTYLAVCAMVVLIWAFTGPAFFFWPIFLIAGWGIGVVIQAYVVYGGRRFTESQIQQEVKKLG